MAKLKSRAARKQQRVKVARAEAHGLPAPELPQPAKKAPRDPVLRNEIARRSPAAAGARAERVAAANQNSGLPTIYRVLIGAAAAIGLVFGLSQLRKADQIDAPAQADAESSRPSNELNSSSLSQSVPTDAPVPVVDAAAEVAENDRASEPQMDDESSAPEAQTPEAQTPEANTVAPSQPKTVVPVTPQAVAPTEPKIVAPAQPKIVAPAQPKIVAPTQPKVVAPAETSAPQLGTPKAPVTPQAPTRPGPASDAAPQAAE